ncbi:2-C-methyl-D-erythritol 4-phosphate cytidylyltransferase [Bowmanella yangjiangensis]|uniref:2-C-methyl-D-erythritol 4-phosphate cytidylyltransferase n=1 Tax=Bowmanella yangjiangensis TaxID=2811230 RepID=A0ABS3CMQ4_9ALTE|nr:2-C-methyl-D-erythritol 4-phosphate cytidylyltransferase [Bowmanella yangjiangensis]MBN7818383.1 2-C-methyl-D-erythritol 4-phosphate cytidylyltransferase [Bowmanella yangjiangensis]
MTPPSKQQFTVVVPAAGVGKRMQTDVPKQYLPILGKTLLEQCLDNLIAHPRIKHIVVALHPRDPYFADLPVAKAPWLTRVDGGKERADSVLAGLNVLDDEWVLVHDAARPCLPHQDLDALLALADGEQGGILAYAVRDTMKQADKTGCVAATLDRSNMWHALTPQFFPLAVLRDALTKALNAQAVITDEASAMEWAGQSVKLVEANPCNIKVTQPVDLMLAEFYLSKLLNNGRSNL